MGEGGKRARRREWLVGGLFLVLALILMGLPGAYREGIAQGVRSTVLRPVLALQQGTVEREARFDDPSRLRAERDSLAALMIAQAALAGENRQLRGLLGLRERLPASFIPAEVVHIPGRGAEYFFQLTAGGRQGVQAGAPIVTPDGLVGRVRNVDDDVSFGIDWTDPEFRASAMTVDGSVYGIVEPRAIGDEDMLALTGTPRHVRLRPGTMIVTSGVGGVYPRGIPIGTVIGVEGRETSWQRSYIIRPMVSPSEMAYVLVLGAPQQSLSGDDLAAAWGIRGVREVQVDTAAAAAAEAASNAARTVQAPAVPEIRAPTPEVAAPRPTGPPLLGQPVAPPRPVRTDTLNLTGIQDGG